MQKIYSTQGDMYAVKKQRFHPDTYHPIKIIHILISNRMEGP